MTRTLQARPAVSRVLGRAIGPALALGLAVGPDVAAPAGATVIDPGRSSTPASRVLVVLDGVRVALPAGTTQVVTARHTVGTRARVTLWQHGQARWTAIARTSAGRTGAGGLVPGRLRQQATGTTPLGTYRLISSFGSHPVAATWKMPYRTIARGDYWVEDNDSAYYNRYRNKAEGGFRWWLPLSDVDSSERLRDYPTQYEYSVVIAFNYVRPVRHRGAGIFLHVNGRGATAGCVSAPRWFLRRTFAALDPARRPVIAIGR
jgi:L,D-peptidoglycan transpeptidase YkuD (ErfK/YbiS/YcfS/YnhG family)